MLHTPSVQREQSVEMSSYTERDSRWSAPAGLIAVLAIGLLAIPGVVAHYALHGGLNVFHILFSLFFSTNLVICYWEICLFFRRDDMDARAEYWRRRGNDGGRTPAIAFLTARVPLSQVCSPTVWADVWAAYSTFDSAYIDRNTYGFNVDIANGFATPVPTLILYVAFTGGLLPAVAVGILGTMLCWQWVYLSSLYLVSFFVGQKRNRLSRRDFYIFILGMNSAWILIPVVGLYVSIRLILDDNFSVLGF